jgi:hypothetical protein
MAGYMVFWLSQLRNCLPPWRKRKITSRGVHSEISGAGTCLRHTPISAITAEITKIPIVVVDRRTKRATELLSASTRDSL